MIGREWWRDVRQAACTGEDASAAKADCRLRLGAGLRHGARELVREMVRGWRGERRCLACAGVFRLPEGESESACEADAQDVLSSARGHSFGKAIFCPDCSSLLRRREKGYCPRCGDPAAWPDLPVAPCARCLTTPPPWDGFFFYGIHEGLLRQLLIRLKFDEQVLLGHALGSLLATHPGLRTLRADAVSAIPLHRARLVRRGYNQALELARAMADALGLPLLPGLLRRTRNSPPQEGANRAARRRNTLNAFAGLHEARDKQILLVDDTLTTGATMEEAVRALRAAGAHGVHVAVVSRTAGRGTGGKGRSV